MTGAPAMTPPIGAFHWGYSAERFYVQLRGYETRAALAIDPNAALVLLGEFDRHTPAKLEALLCQMFPHQGEVVLNARIVQALTRGSEPADRRVLYLALRDHFRARARMLSTPSLSE